MFNEIEDCNLKLAPLFENGYIEGRNKIYTFKDKKFDLSKINKHWLINEKQFNDLIEKDEIVLINNLPYRASYAMRVGNLWSERDMLDFYNRAEEAKIYDTPKPEAILNRIISIASNENDTVADFFMGGGTTAVVTKKLNRKGIFCDINKKACEVAVNKIKTISK